MSATPREFAHFEALDREAQEAAIRRLAADGLSEHSIAAACRLAIEQVRRVLAREPQVAERQQRDRILALFAELGRLTQREAKVRREIAQLLEQPRSPAADVELGNALQGFAEARQ